MREQVASVRVHETVNTMDWFGALPIGDALNVALR